MCWYYSTLYVCMYVGMYVCMCMYECMHTTYGIRYSIRTYIYARKYTNVCMHVYIKSICTYQTYKCTYIHILKSCSLLYFVGDIHTYSTYCTYIHTYIRTKFASIRSIIRTFAQRLGRNLLLSFCGPGRCILIPLDPFKVLV